MNDPTRGSAQPPGPPQPPADDEAATLRAYRDAAAQAGEAPRADTRAAILAAAARQVQARPQPVGRAAPLTRYRAPLALAASLLVGTIAWQLSAQFDEPAIGTDTVQEAPAASTAAAPSAAATAPAPAAAAVPPPAAARGEEATRQRAVEAQRAAPVVPSRDGASRSAAQSTPQPGAAASAAPPTPPGGRDMASKPTRDDRPPVPAAPAEPVPATPPAPAPAAISDGPPALPKVTAAPAAPASAGSDSAAAVAAPAPPPAAPPRPAALRMAPVPGAPPAVGGATSESLRPKTERAPAEEQVRIQPVERRRFAEDPVPRPLAAWIALVTELRAAGRHTEADRELQALRMHYPQAQIPAAALPAAER